MTQNETHETLWSMSESIEKFLTRTEELTEELYQKRAEIWAALVANGIEQKEIAERTGVDPSDVSRSLSTRGL